MSGQSEDQTLALEMNKSISIVADDQDPCHNHEREESIKSISIIDKTPIIEDIQNYDVNKLSDILLTQNNSNSMKQDVSSTYKRPHSGKHRNNRLSASKRNYGNYDYINRYYRWRNKVNSKKTNGKIIPMKTHPSMGQYQRSKSHSHSRDNSDSNVSHSIANNQSTDFGDRDINVSGLVVVSQTSHTGSPLGPAPTLTCRPIYSNNVDMSSGGSGVNGSVTNSSNNTSNYKYNSKQNKVQFVPWVGSSYNSNSVSNMNFGGVYTSVNNSNTNTNTNTNTGSGSNKSNTQNYYHVRIGGELEDISKPAIEPTLYLISQQSLSKSKSKSNTINNYSRNTSITSNTYSTAAINYNNRRETKVLNKLQLQQIQQKLVQRSERTLYEIEHIDTWRGCFRSLWKTENDLAGFSVIWLLGMIVLLILYFKNYGYMMDNNVELINIFLTPIIISSITWVFSWSITRFQKRNSIEAVNRPRFLVPYLTKVIFGCMLFFWLFFEDAGIYDRIKRKSDYNDSCWYSMSTVFICLAVSLATTEVMITTVMVNAAQNLRDDIPSNWSVFLFFARPLLWVYNRTICMFICFYLYFGVSCTILGVGSVTTYKCSNEFGKNMWQIGVYILLAPFVNPLYLFAHGFDSFDYSGKDDTAVVSTIVNQVLIWTTIVDVVNSLYASMRYLFYKYDLRDVFEDVHRHMIEQRINSNLRDLNVGQRIKQTLTHKIGRNGNDKDDNVTVGNGNGMNNGIEKDDRYGKMENKDDDGGDRGSRSSSKSTSN